MLRLLICICFALASILCYSDFKEPDAAFDSEVIGVSLSASRSQVIINLRQDPPEQLTYSSHETASSYNVVVQCISRDVAKLWLFDTVNPVYRMEEADPFPNIFNLGERVPPRRHNYTAGFLDEEMSLEECSVTVAVHQWAGYVEIEISHDGNLLRLVGFRVQKRMVFLHMHLDAKFLMGLGQRNGRFRIEKGMYTLWSKDNLFAVQHESGCQNTYSYHPMVLYQDTATKAFELLYIRSTSALEVEIESTPTGKLLLMNLHANSFEMLMFRHASAKQVVEQYHEYIGGYKIPPLWYFGFHQSRWGYKDVQMVSDIVKGYNRSKLKLESLFLDIDYMKDKKPFCVDSENFPTDKLRKLKRDNDIKIVPIVDFAFNFDFQSDLSADLKKSMASSGVKLDHLFIRSADGNLYVGRVWPGKSIFPDFHHPHIAMFWQPYLTHLHSQIPFDGVWLDMNEIANFDPVAVEPEGYSHMKLECGEPLSNMSLPMSAVHSNGWPQMYMHNINCIKQQQITERIGKELVGDEFYFISRSTFPGSGKYGGHWSGDNLANEQFLEYSVSSLLNFNLFGIPFCGSDVCGFFGDYDEDLCSRWIQSNTVFPFFRNHNHIESKDQEFYKIGPDIEKSISNAMNLRYSLLKYIYNLFVLRRSKGLIYYPPAFEFVSDFAALSEPQTIQSHVMVGPDLLFAVGASVYLPANVTWYKLNSRFSAKAIGRRERPRTVEQYLKTYEEIPLYVREGAVILQQQVESVYRVSQLPPSYTLKCFLDYNLGCSLIYHDEQAHKQNSQHPDNYSYQLMGKLAFHPNTTRFQRFTLSMKNTGSPESIFVIALDRIVVIWEAEIALGNGLCGTTYQAGDTHLHGLCSAFQKALGKDRVELSRHPFGDSMEVQSGSALVFQVLQSH